MLEQVEWGNFRLGSLFDVDNWIYGKNKQYDSRISDPTDNSIAVVSGITENNGVNYYTEDKLSDNEIFEGELTISTRGEYSGTVFYHNKKFVLANNILVMFMPGYTKNQKLFLGSIINSLSYGGYSGYPRKETLKEDMIQLPIKNGKIDFEFMDKFIAELEAERQAELEAERQAELEAYFKITGLQNYELTSDELNALKEFEKGKINREIFNVIDIFNVKNTGNILSRDIIENSGTTPYLCASSENNGVSSYITYDEKYLDKGNCIFIGGKTFVVSFQESDFYSNDSHNLVLYLKDSDRKTKLNQLCLACCINKSLGHKYTRGDSISNKKIQSDKIIIPTINNQPNYKFMETFISAVQKLVIKDVVVYNQERIKATAEIINK